MANNLETKVNETLPAIKLENGLDKLIDGMSPIELVITGFATQYMLMAADLNFNLQSVDKKQEERIKRIQIKMILDHIYPDLIGGMLGFSAYLITESLVFFASAYMFGWPGIGTYFGAKAVTNYLGYRYYKNQSKKHEELEKIYLLGEGNGKRY